MSKELLKSGRARDTSARILIPGTKDFRGSKEDNKERESKGAKRSASTEYPQDPNQ